MQSKRCRNYNEVVECLRAGFEAVYAYKNIVSITFKVKGGYIAVYQGSEHEEADVFEYGKMEPATDVDKFVVRIFSSLERLQAILKLAPKEWASYAEYIRPLFRYIWKEQGQKKDGQNTEKMPILPDTDLPPMRIATGSGVSPDSAHC